MSTHSSLSRSLSTWAVKLGVFGLLGGIGWWGHHTHWTLPAIDWTTETAEAAAVSPAAKTDTSSATGFPSRLPIIEFATDQAARNCGIATEVVVERSITDVIAATGVVGFDQTRYAQLAARVPGIVWRVEKRLGDAVQAGDVLVIVDSTEVGQAKAALVEAAVTYQLKSQILQRLEKIPESIAKRELHEAEAAFKIADVQQFNAIQKLVNFGFPIRLEEIAKLSKEELTARLQVLGLPEKFKSETASANLVPLIAPFAGVVTKCDVALGEVVETSKPEYVVADMQRMWIHLDVRQEDASRLKLGAKALVRSEGDSDALPCKITWIGAEVDPKTRTIQARAEVENPIQEEAEPGRAPRRRLRVNAYCSAEIQVGDDLKSQMVVHNNALHWQWEIGKQIVFVSLPDQRRFEPRIVSKGLVHGDLVQIIDGVKPGERVVTAGSRILSSELSERLQTHVGENAEAVREFDDVKSRTSPAI